MYCGVHLGGRACVSCHLRLLDYLTYIFDEIFLVCVREQTLVLVLVALATRSTLRAPEYAVQDVYETPDYFIYM